MSICKFLIYSARKCLIWYWSIEAGILHELCCYKVLRLSWTVQIKAVKKDSERHSPSEKGDDEMLYEETEISDTKEMLLCSKIIPNKLWNKAKFQFDIWARF